MGGNTWNPFALSPGSPKPRKEPKLAKQSHKKRHKFHGPLYNLEEAQAYLGGLSDTYVKQLVADGKLRRFKLRGRSGSPIRLLLFAQSELDRFISANYG